MKLSMKRETARAQWRCSSQTDIKLFYKMLGWLNIAVQLMFPVAAAFTPVVTARADDTAQTTARTRPYVLGPGETVRGVARRYQLTVAQLKKSTSFEHSSAPLNNFKLAMNSTFRFCLQWTVSLLPVI